MGSRPHLRCPPVRGKSIPKGAALKDYAFEEGPASLDRGDTPVRTVRLSELFTARIRKETGQLENTAKLRTLRRDIARAETILREQRVSRSERQGAGE